MNTNDCTHDCHTCGGSCGIGPVPPANLPQREFIARIKALRTMRSQLKLDALLLFDQLNNYYFTGLTCDNGMLTIAKGEPAFYTDFRFLVAAKRLAPFLDLRLLKGRRNFSELIASAGKTWKRVGIEGGIDAKKYLMLREALPDAELVFIDNSLAAMRSIKSRAEINAIRKSIALNDAVLQTWLNEAQELTSATEWEIRTSLRGLMDFVAQGEAFDTIVCAGKNAAECHHEPDETLFTKGKPLLIDMGVKCDHYCSDMTRMVFKGAPKKEYLDLLNLVSAANRAAIASIRPGIPCEAIDAVARKVLAKAGFEKAFRHSLGHSFGLFIHESPSFAPGNTTLLKPGMVLTVEPGIYLPGRLGIRIEDDILVTETGCEVLTTTPHEIII